MGKVKPPLELELSSGFIQQSVLKNNSRAKSTIARMLTHLEEAGLLISTAPFEPGKKLTWKITSIGIHCHGCLTNVLF